MRLTISKKPLLHLLSRCVSVADKKSTLPVLANVLLTAEDGRLTIAATNLNIAVSGSVDATVTEPGAIALPARDLLERVKMMPDGDVTITTTDAGAATVKSGSRRYTMNGLPADEFPHLPTVTEGSQSFEVTSETLATLIAQTQFAISTDETRAHLNSALLEVHPSRLRMVATDGHRLAVADRSAADVTGAAELLIPLKAVGEIRRLLEEDSGALVTVTQSLPNLFVEASGVVLAVKLVDAQFPPYQQVIPETSPASVKASRLALADAIRAVSVAASDRTGGVKLTFRKAGTVSVEAESPESGEGSDEVPIEATLASDLLVGVNANYLLDALLAIDGDEVAISLGGELDPVVVKPAAVSAGGSYLAVVMPLRI